MFKTAVGPVDDGTNFAYMRPETAQAIFTNFRHVVDSTARRPPFGIAQIGKAFRNEITPRNFIFRVREFEQMELEFFVTPGTDEDWHRYWVEARIAWWEPGSTSGSARAAGGGWRSWPSPWPPRTSCNLPPRPRGARGGGQPHDRPRFPQQGPGGPALSASVEPNTDSNTRLAIQNPDNKAWQVPYVIEPSAGVDRGVLAVLNEAYRVESLDNGSERTVLALPRHLAPLKAAVIPLKKNHDGIVDTARALKARLQKLGLGRILYEHSGNIGKAYRRHDEVGTPLCITIDFETIEGDGTSRFGIGTA